MITAVGISTMNEGIFSALKNVENKPHDVPVIIVHQIINFQSENFIDIKNLKSKNITIITDTLKGLSRSRNLLLKEAKKMSYDYLILSDDDVSYEWKKLSLIEEYIKEFPNAHFQFMSLTETNGDNRKQYPSRVKELSKKDLFKVSSIEMCLNINRTFSGNVRFDERFGLGADYPVGEEAVFLTDLNKKGDKVIFIPVPFTCHPIESTGIKLYTEKKMILSRGALIRRCYGSVLGIPVLFIFWAKKFILKQALPGMISNMDALVELWRGFHGNR